MSLPNHNCALIPRFRILAQRDGLFDRSVRPLEDSDAEEFIAPLHLPAMLEHPGPVLREIQVTGPGALQDRGLPLPHARRGPQSACDLHPVWGRTRKLRRKADQAFGGPKSGQRPDMERSVVIETLKR